MSINSNYNNVKSWIDLHIKQNGQKMITGIIGNEAYTKVLNFAKAIWDTKGQADGIATLNSSQKLTESQRALPGLTEGKIWQGNASGIPAEVDPPEGAAPEITRHRANPTIITGTPNTLTLNFNSKNELIAKKSGGGGIDAGADFTFAFANAGSAEYAQVFLNITASITITLPANCVTASPLALETGSYQAVFAFDGTNYHFVISEPES